MCKKPLIGILGKPRDLGGRFKYILISDDVKNAVLRSGGFPIGLMPLDDKYVSESFKLNSYKLTSADYVNIEDMVGRCDGIILQGGLVLNGYEEYVAKLCLELNIPILGICCGFDVMLKATGHDVKMGGADFHWAMDKYVAHEILLKPDSYFYSVVQEKSLKVNSIHKSITKPEEIGACWRVGAICVDYGSVEVIESVDCKFAVGLRFHPELMNDLSLNRILLVLLRLAVARLVE